MCRSNNFPKTNDFGNKEEKEEPQSMKETTYTVKIPAILALLGDLHGRPYQQAIASLQKNKPQIIAIAGDIVYGHQPEDDISPLVSQPYILPFLEHCAAIAPTFLSLGNHEWMLDEQDLEQIKNTGVILLDNSWTKHGDIVLGGLTPAVVTDYRQYRLAHPNQNRRYPVRRQTDPDEPIKARPAPDLSWLPAYGETPGFHILLSHHPEYYPRIPKNIDLILSCHAHGGQWRFYNPIKRQSQGLYAPGQGFFPRWTKGIYDNRLIVSAGLANTAPAPRFFNPTEIVYLIPEP
jgi:hypothetical protein